MEENQMVSDQPQEPVSDIQSEIKQDTVKYETYKKTVGEVKTVKQKLAEREALIEQLQREKMDAEKDQAAKADYYKSKFDEATSKLNDLTETLEFSSVSKRVEHEALNQGCVDTNALMTFFSEQDWKELRAAGEDLDSDDVNGVIERVKKRHPKIKLFEKPRANVNTVVPAHKEVKKQKPFTEMSVDELREYRETLKKQGVNNG
jgi:hypothetical protein